MPEPHHSLKAMSLVGILLVVFWIGSCAAPQKFFPVPMIMTNSTARPMDTSTQPALSMEVIDDQGVTMFLGISSHVLPSSVRPALFFYLPIAASTRVPHPIA